MFIEPSFIESVQDLYAPIQGTERVAELLYVLIRMIRPTTVLEAGMGYTSAFIAKGLRDNVMSWQIERDGLINKTRKYISDLGQIPRQPISEIRHRARGLAAVYEAKTSSLATRRTRWMFDPPELARPGYYLKTHEPRAYCIDDLTGKSSSAANVLKKLDELRLREFVSVHEGNFWAFDLKALPFYPRPIDLLWIDLPVGVLNAMDLVDGKYWNLLNADGGLMLIHCMLTNSGGQALLQEFEHIRLQHKPARFEMMGFIEPHKVVQNNVLIIRKTSALKYETIEDSFTAAAEHIFERDARLLI